MEKDHHGIHGILPALWSTQQTRPCVDVAEHQFKVCSVTLCCVAFLCRRSLRSGGFGEPLWLAFGGVLRGILQRLP